MNTTENSTIAPLTNVALTVAALERSINRPISFAWHGGLERTIRLGQNISRYLHSE